MSLRPGHTIDVFQQSRDLYMEKSVVGRTVKKVRGDLVTVRRLLRLGVNEYNEPTLYYTAAAEGALSSEPWSSMDLVLGPAVRELGVALDDPMRFGMFMGEQYWQDATHKVEYGQGPTGQYAAIEWRPLAGDEFDLAGLPYRWDVHSHISAAD